MTAEEILQAAVELTTHAQRREFLDSACGGDAALRTRVEGLLLAHDAAGSFLEQPLFDPPATAQSVGEQPGAQIGPYKLLQQIGEGGMGTVFLAEQTRPVQRKVALKIIKAGLDNRQVLVRFEAERQAIALMDHPNIARFHDAGATESGRPYFVMELVTGVPITKFCDEHCLGPRQRLELFVPICLAVQHAHQKGIIHRDLKPSNVLVTLYDDKPVPKVIDFGVAKATGLQLNEETLNTGFGAVVGTFEYMSPEQAGFNQLDVDTRSDVYSLGVLLYELLAGSPPFTSKELEQAGVLEMLRVIREREPSKPSTKLSTAEGLPTLAANRGTEPAKLTRLVRGELDWIVMKSLEKDRARRYETANGFAADVLRYLADEPVQACPPSAGYRLRKFARRNKRSVLAASLVALALVVGILGTTVGMLRAKTAEANASREANEKAEALKEAKLNLEDAMAAVDQFQTRLGDECLNVPQMEPILRELRQDALKFYQKFLARKSNDPVIRWETARCYSRMGKIYYQLGQDSGANEAYLKAIAMMEEQGAATSRNRDHRSELFQTHMDYSWVVVSKADQCVHQRRYAVEVAERLVADFGDLPDLRASWLSARSLLAFALNYSQPGESERILLEILPLVNDHELLGQIHNNLGLIYWASLQWPKAVHHFRHALKQREKGFADAPDAIWPRRSLALAIVHLAHALAANQQLVEAEEYERRAIPIFDRLAREYPTGPIYRQDLAWTLQEHAGLLKQLGKTPEAERTYRRALELYEKLSVDFPSTPKFRQSAFVQRITLSLLLDQGGRPQDAQEVRSKATMVSAKPADDSPGRLVHKQDLVRTHLELARLFKASGKTVEAETSFEQAFAIQEALEKDFADKPEFRRELARAHQSTARQLAEDGRRKEAELFFRRAESHWRQLVVGAPDDVEGLRGLASTWHSLAPLLEAKSLKQDAVDALAHGFDALEKLSSLLPRDLELRAWKGHSLSSMAHYLRHIPGRTEETEKRFREALRIFEALHFEFPDDAGYWHFLAYTHQQIGHTLRAAHKPQEAEESFRRAVELHDQRAAKLPDHPEFNLDVSKAYADLGDQLIANGRVQQAKKIHQAADALLKKNSQGVKREPEKKQN